MWLFDYFFLIYDWFVNFYGWFVFVSANDCINFFIDVEVLKMIQALELSAKMQISAAVKLVLCKERKYDGEGIARWKKNGGTKKIEALEA